MSPTKQFKPSVPSKRDKYLEQLETFMNDNLMTIADLINIKKQLEGDIKTFKQQTEQLDLTNTDLLKKNDLLQKSVSSEYEKQIALEF